MVHGLLIRCERVPQAGTCIFYNSRQREHRRGARRPTTQQNIAYTRRGVKKIREETKESFSVISSQLGLPDPLDSLRQANVVSLELIKAGRHSQSSSAETPLEERPGLRNASSGKVVDDEGPG